MRVIFLIVAIAAAAHAELELLSLHGMQHLYIFYETPEQFNSVKFYEDNPGFDFLRINDDHIQLLVAGDQVNDFKDFLNQKNIKYIVAEEDVERVVEESVADQLRRRELQYSPSSVYSFDYYPRYDEVNNYLERIAETYSDVASLINIGKSYEGREMKGLKLSDGRPNNPAIFIDAGIHAREWIAPTTALYIIEQLLVNATNKDCLRGVDWYIVPLFNPDGYEFTHTSTANRLWRKTRSRNGNTCLGVDGNRNFDMAWMSVGASSDPCSLTYAGPKAFSEPETQNVRDVLLGLKGPLKVYLTLHSYGQFILYPWGYTRDLPENEPELRDLARECAKSIASVRNVIYTYGTSANHLYPSSGGSDDWAMDKAGAELSYTFELPGGNYGFMLPAKYIKVVGAETFEAIKVIHKYTRSKYGSRSGYLQ